jgi:hypothetical protein
LFLFYELIEKHHQSLYLPAVFPFWFLASCFLFISSSTWTTLFILDYPIHVFFFYF